MKGRYDGAPALLLPRLGGPLSGSMRRGAGQALRTMPFDALRFRYANAVVLGLVPRSILASAKSEKFIDRLERLVLGPMARRR